MGTLISATELADIESDAHPVVLDCRFSLADPAAGRRQFEQGHIPGAQYIDLDRDLSSPVMPGKTGRHPLPDRETFAETLGRFGITADSMVICYDEAAGPFAARCWWMLRWLGHPNAFVLDGGLKAWTESGQALTTEMSHRTPTLYVPSSPLTRVVSAEDLAEVSGSLLDARDQARFDGEVDPIDPVAGHIPGALCATFTANLHENSRMKPVAELRERFAALGVTTNGDVTCYCGSGVTAAHNILALVHAGYPEPALYPGSWSEWITDPARPVARG
ncbi:MAG: sulfurtransferase [Pseudomonadales bacterium]|nr:sulfurtransferase [Pseudomonadales bacterium]